MKPDSGATNSPSETLTPPQKRQIDRAIGDLRRNLPVLLKDPDSGQGAAVLSAELASEADIGLLKQLTGRGPDLVLTDKRSHYLHIPPNGDSVQRLALPPSGDIAAFIRSLADPARDLESPLRGPFRRVREKPGPAVHAAIKLLKAAQLLPAALFSTCDGERIEALAERENLLVIDPAHIAAFETARAIGLHPVTAATVPLADAPKTRLIAFRPDGGGVEHLAILIGDPRQDQPVLTRLHSECFTGDLIGSLKCDCGQQLRGAIAEISAQGGGVLLYLAQEGRGIGLMNKLRAYHLQDLGFDTVDANERLGFEADERIFLPAKRMLDHLGIRAIRLMTNNPDKVSQLRQLGIDVVERVAHKFPANSHNEAYLATKKRRSGHYL